jgi:hypothetical protein
MDEGDSSTDLWTFAFDGTCEVNALRPADFQIEVVPEVMEIPEVESLQVDENEVTLRFAEPLPLGHWTCATFRGESNRVCVARVPGDVFANGAANPQDLIGLLDCLNRPDLCLPHQCDLDWDLSCNAQDVAMEIELLEVSDVALSVPCPS